MNNLNQKLANINILKIFSLIITCRENYVYELRKIECDFITLQTWDNIQIKSFCDIYGKVGKKTTSQTSINKLLEKKEIFGIPLILYMVLALDIAIEKSESLVDVYDQIFSTDRSSIYDRCIENSRYGAEHRISKDEIKQVIHQISQRIAFWIFENNSEKAFISQKYYEDICNTVIKENSNGNDDIKRDFLIGNYFKLINHCDGVGTQELYFNHRSLYEYFVAVYFFESIRNLTSKEEVAGKLGELLMNAQLSKQILEFIKYKFDYIKRYNWSDVAREIFNMMLSWGMTAYMKEKCQCLLMYEMYIFQNMLEFVHLWNVLLGKMDDDMILFYLQLNRLHFLNLKGIKLYNKTLLRVELGNANLSEADLRKADLRKAGLTGVDLSGSDLSEADLRGADLNKANLSEANLSETIFDEEQVGILHEKYDLSKSKIFISRTDEIVSYIDYCSRKKG